MLELRPSADRGVANFGWLDSRHTFSFGQYRDSHQYGYSDLLVINEDRVQPGTGFGTHGHQDMEIFTYVLEGALEHRDSIGTGSVIRPGDVQMMSAGTGIRHSEYNASKAEMVHFLQIWIVPATKGVAPRYQQVHVATAEKRGRLKKIISPDGRDGALSVYQDASVHVGLFDGDEKASLALTGERHAYVHVARGSVEVNGTRLAAGDGARIRGESRLDFCAGAQSEVLAFDLRPHDTPQI